MDRLVKDRPTRRFPIARLEGPPVPRDVTVCFEQPCPACGRRLWIDVEHLGERVFCDHCGRGFMAQDAAIDGHATAGSADAILARAERLLAALRRRRAVARGNGNRAEGGTGFWQDR